MLWGRRLPASIKESHFVDCELAFQLLKSLHQTFLLLYFPDGRAQAEVDVHAFDIIRHHIGKKIVGP